MSQRRIKSQVIRKLDKSPQDKENQVDQYKNTQTFHEKGSTTTKIDGFWRHETIP
jgi:hypothetical protein